MFPQMAEPLMRKRTYVTCRCFRCGPRGKILRPSTWYNHRKRDALDATLGKWSSQFQAEALQRNVYDETTKENQIVASTSQKPAVPPTVPRLVDANVVQKQRQLADLDMGMDNKAVAQTSEAAKHMDRNAISPKAPYYQTPQTAKAPPLMVSKRQRRREADEITAANQRKAMHESIAAAINPPQPPMALAPSPFHQAQPPAIAPAPIPPVPPSPALVYTRSSTPPEETPRRASLSRIYEVLGPLKEGYAPVIVSENESIPYPPNANHLNPIQHEAAIAKEVIRRHGLAADILPAWPRWSVLKLRTPFIQTVIHSLSSRDTPSQRSRFIRFENLHEDRKIGYAEVVWFSEFTYDDGTSSSNNINNNNNNTHRTPDSRDLLNCYCRVYGAIEIFKGFVKVSRTDAFVSFPVNWIRGLVDLYPVLDAGGNPALNHFWIERE